MFAETLSAMFAGPLAVSASWRAAGGSFSEAGRGFFEETTEILDGDVMAEAPTLLVPATQWPTARKLDTIIVNGRTFSLRMKPRLEQDGAVKRLVLAEL